MSLARSICVVFLVVSLLAAEQGDDDDLIVQLNDGNFEHLTQASTGATTGDWLILMAPKGECKQCVKIEVVLKKVASEFRGRINIAKIDREDSRLTQRRFQIKSPTLRFFRLGGQWEYNGMMAASNIGHFITEGFQRKNPQYIPKQIDSFDAWQEDFIKEMKAAYKQRRLPKKNALMTAVAGLFLGLVILFCILSPKKKTEKENKRSNDKRQSKKKR